MGRGLYYDGRFTWVGFVDALLGREKVGWDETIPAHISLIWDRLVTRLRIFKGCGAIGFP